MEFYICLQTNHVFTVYISIKKETYRERILNLKSDSIFIKEEGKKLGKTGLKLGENELDFQSCVRLKSNVTKRFFVSA